MDINKIIDGFPPGMVVPGELAELCQWEEKNGYPISGSFELRADHHSTLKYWFGHDRVTDRFGLFGAGPDGSLYGIWREDHGKDVIVHLGSEGDPNMVLATHFIDFLRLLAVGYDEIGFSDLSSPPEPEGVNPVFSQWVATTFNVSIPTLGTEITLPAQEASQDFKAWIKSVL